MNQRTTSKRTERMKARLLSSLSAIFGNIPFSVSVSTQNNFSIISVSYQDFLSVVQLRKELLAFGSDNHLSLSFDRSMSIHTLNLLLENLYEHPEELYADSSMHGNIRMFILERFIRTDF